MAHFIFMLTCNDRTIADAREIFARIADLPLQFCSSAFKTFHIAFCHFGPNHRSSEHVRALAHRVPLRFIVQQL
jgi:hypothetical protein